MDESGSTHRFPNGIRPGWTRVVAALLSALLYTPADARRHPWSPPVVPLAKRDVFHVYDAVFSRDGRRVLTASEDGTARIWDVASHRQIRMFAGHAFDVHTARFSADERCVFTTSVDGTARVWDTRTGKEVYRFGEPSRELFKLGAVDFSPDGKRLVVCQPFTARLYDLVTKKMLGEVRVPDGKDTGIGRVVFSPDGRRILIATFDGVLRVWDPDRQGLEEHPLQRLGNPTSIAWLRDGHRVLVAYHADGIGMRLWDLETGTTIHRYDIETHDIVLSHDERRFAAIDSQSVLRIVDLASGEEIRRLPAAGTQGFHFSPSGQRIVTADDDDAARIYDTVTGKLLATLYPISLPPNPVKIDWMNDPYLGVMHGHRRH
jgi:WD40 repeat protein